MSLLLKSPQTFQMDRVRPAFTETQDYKGNPAYLYDDIKFANVAELSRTGKYFLENKTYTKAPYGSQDWLDFWVEESARCRDGVVLPGALNRDGLIDHIHITGEHYFYLNYCPIQATEADNVIETISKDHISNVAEKVDRFPDFFDGDYFFFKAKEYARRLGLNLVVIKARRKGYSYKTAAMALHRATFFPKSTTVFAAYLSDYLYPQGTMAMVKKYVNNIHHIEYDPNTKKVIAKATGFAKRTLNANDELIRFGYKDPQNPIIERGYLSKIMALTFNNNPGAARGKDFSLMLIEEAGKAPNLKAFLEQTQSTMEDGKKITGQWVLFGTGGGDNINWVDFEYIAKNPELFKHMPFANTWEPGAENTTFAMFVPHVQNLIGHSYKGVPLIDVNGNSNLPEAYDDSEHERAAKKEHSKNPADYSAFVAERCNTPSEAFSVTGQSIFDISELITRINAIKANKQHSNFVDGHLLLSGKNLVFSKQDKYGKEHSYIDDFPFKKGQDVTGCVRIYDAPLRLNGMVPKGLYRIWVDPYSHDKDAKDIKMTDSLGSIYVYMKANKYHPTKGDILVAEYVGRPEMEDDFNEQLMFLAYMYGADPGMIMFENDRGTIAKYFRRYNKSWLLADEPDFDWNPDLKAKTGRKKGMHMNEERKATGVVMFRDWTRTPRGRDELTGKLITNLDYINSIPLLQEMIKWSRKGNYDRVSTMIVGMYDKEESMYVSIKPVEAVDSVSRVFSRPMSPKRRR